MKKGWAFMCCESIDASCYCKKCGNLLLSTGKCSNFECSVRIKLTEEECAYYKKIAISCVDYGRVWYFKDDIEKIEKFVGINLEEYPRGGRDMCIVRLSQNEVLLGFDALLWKEQELFYKAVEKLQADRGFKLESSPLPQEPRVYSKKE